MLLSLVNPVELKIQLRNQNIDFTKKATTIFYVIITASKNGGIEKVNKTKVYTEHIVQCVPVRVQCYF